MKKLIFLTLFVFPLLAGALSHSDGIEYPFYHEDHSGETQVMPLHFGEEAYQLRLELVRRAQKTIDVEYYIYNMDVAGKIFTHELIRAAERGVKVRILVDKLATELNPFVAHDLLEKGIELKFYNTNVFFKIGAINFRNHRKLLIVDGAEAITGGRNMADDYFNLAEKYNYEDRDVYVKGPIVEAMKDSFEAFYNHKIVHSQKRPSRPRLRSNGRGAPDGLAQQKSWDRAVKKSQEFLKETEEELIVRAAIEKAAAAQLANKNIYPCPVATFVTDSPGATESKTGKGYEDKYRHVRKTFLDKILPIDKSLIVSSPYFIPSKQTTETFEELLEKGVDVSLYTNSLRSTDVLLMSSGLYLRLRGWLKKGMHVLFNDAHFSERQTPALETAKTSHWGTHAKTHIYETSTYSEVMIGTYNLDNRSDYFNTELAFFCKGNDDYTQDVKADVLGLASKGLRVESLSHAIDRNGEKINITGSSGFKQLKMKLFTIPSWLMTHLL